MADADDQASRVTTDDQFDHKTEWQSAAVARAYDQKRFSSLTGRVFDALEKWAITRQLDYIEREQPLRRVLDIPCGTGRIARLLVQRRYDLVCGDISQQMLEVARGQLADAAAEFLPLDIYDLPFPSDSFDCVCCIRLFQHLTSDQRMLALRELARVSKRYVIANAMYTSMYYGLVRRVRLALGRYAPRYTMSEQEMKHELTGAGLTLVRRIFPQPGYGGNVVMLMEKSRGNDAGNR
jgi:ubiquinone/menaquinone biosynthesis C-methylase UbiE